MASDDNSGSNHACDDAQGMKVLRASLLTQKTALIRALADSVDCRFQTFEGRFGEIVDRLDALVIGANRDRNDDRRRLKDDVAQANLSIGLYLHITVDNPSIVMI